MDDIVAKTQNSAP